MSDEVDVIVLGMGVGGEDVAGRLAESGMDVIGIENGLVGGECPYWGCIPSKMTIRAANLLAETRRVDGMAGRAHAIPDFTPVAQRIRDEATSSWDDTIAADRFTGKGGKLIRGRGRLSGPGQVTVDDTTYRARRGVVVSTGASPVIPPIPGLAETPYWTNRQLLEAVQLPDSLLILGGGSIGVELAQAWCRFGVAVTIVEAGPRIMANEEPDTSALITEVLTSEGVTVLTDTAVNEVSADSVGITLTTADSRQLHAERLLVSTGRRPDLESLGVDTVGLDPAARSITVDGHMRAGDKLWAVGDVTDHGGFTHMATYQANIAVHDICDEPVPGADYRALPRVTFTDPEVGTVGMTERQARDAGINVVCGQSRVAANTRGWIYGPGNAGFVKLVADADHGQLVGATSAGPWGGEVLAGLVVAIHGRVSLASLRTMIYAYPTFHRGIAEALADLDG